MSFPAVLLTDTGLFIIFLIISKALVRILELRVLIIIDCSKVTGAEGNKMSKNYGCQIAFFSKLRVQGTG